MATACTNCGREFQHPGMRFCGNCGAPVSRSDSGASEPTRPDSKVISQESPSSGALQKLIVATLASGMLAIIFLFVRSITRRYPCDSIFEQTAPKLGTTLALLKSKGEIVIGRDKIQDLAESSQKIGIICKTCCIAQQSGKINAEQFEACLDGTRRYEAEVVQTADTVDQAALARSHGDSQLAEQKATQAIADATVAITTASISASKVITEGETVNGSIRTESDRRFFKFTAIGGKTRVIFRKPFSGYVKVMDRDEVTIANQDAAAGDTVTLAVDTTPGALYYIEVGYTFMGVALSGPAIPTTGGFELLVRQE
jgi:hypothetical protein